VRQSAADDVIGFPWDMSFSTASFEDCILDSHLVAGRKVGWGNLF